MEQSIKRCVQYWLVGERFDPIGSIISVKVGRTETIPFCKMPPEKK